MAKMNVHGVRSNLNQPLTDVAPARKFCGLLEINARCFIAASSSRSSTVAIRTYAADELSDSGIVRFLKGTPWPVVTVIERVRGCGPLILSVRVASFFPNGNNAKNLGCRETFISIDPKAGSPISIESHWQMAHIGDPVD